MSMYVSCVYMYVVQERAQDGERQSVCGSVYVCQLSYVFGVSCLNPSEEAGSVECGGPPVSPVFSQAPAHENLFR